MGLFRRIFSSNFRKAVAAEAEGDYLTAARCYALCGEPLKVVDMHLALARQAEDGAQRIRALRLASHFAPEDDRRRPMVLRLLAEALADQGRIQGLETPGGKASLEEAAGLYQEGEGWRQAGDCYLELGDRDRSAQAYGRGGLVERVEEVLGEDEQRREQALLQDRLFKDHEMQLKVGRRDEAAESLRRCVEVSIEPGEYRRLLADLERRLLHGGLMELRVGEERLVLLGRFPLIIGRDPDCDLTVRGHSVSRRHTCITEDLARGGRALMVEDMESRNGTTLSGLPLGGRVPLPESGVLGLGDGCEVAFQREGCLRLEVKSGMDLGAMAVAITTPTLLSEILPGGPALNISFQRGRPMVHAVTGGRGLKLNGSAASGMIQLIAGDRLEVDGAEAVRVGG